MSRSVLSVPSAFSAARRALGGFGRKLVRLLLVPCMCSPASLLSSSCVQQWQGFGTPCESLSPPHATGARRPRRPTVTSTADFAACPPTPPFNCPVERPDALEPHGASAPCESRARDALHGAAREAEPSNDTPTRPADVPPPSLRPALPSKSGSILSCRRPRPRIHDPS